MTEKNSLTARQKRREAIKTLCEGAASIALAVILSYIKFDVGANGGSINFTMVPLIVFALRRGAASGFAASLGFGLLKFILGAEVIAWQSIVFDYILAYGITGIAFIGRYVKAPMPVKAVIGTFIACVLRFAVHFISGVTIYAEWMPEEFLGMTMTNTGFYSLLYNGLYMLPTTLCALVVAPVLYTVLEKSLPVSGRKKQAL